MTLSDFIKRAWHVVEPSVPYIHGWHIDAICEHLTAVSNCQIKNLLINMPPRHAKSLIVSVFWPMWEWTKWPHRKWLYSSYAQNLSIRDSLKCRRLILSGWYQLMFGESFQLIKDQNTKTRFDNDKYGYRIATSVSGLGTGEGGDRIVCLEYDAELICKYGNIKIGYVVENKSPVEVLSYNRIKNKTEYKRILRHFETTNNTLLEFKTFDNKILRCTPNHPLFIIGIGYQEAHQVKQGQLFRTKDNKQSEIIKITTLEGEFKTYNIEVEHNNNYFANDILVHNCDDPHNVLESESELVREGTLIWWSEVMSTRMNDPKTGAKVIVAQRSHARDLSGYVLERGGYDHLCLPAEYEGNKFYTSIGWCDPREKKDELLWPDRFDDKQIKQLKADLGPYATAGQLQQRPAPREGGLVKIHWFKYFKLIKDSHGYTISPKFKLKYQVWDTAFKEGQDNDFSVCHTYGIAEDGFYLIARWKDKIQFPELERVAIMLANEHHPNQIFIEDHASGQSLIQVLQRKTRLPIKAVKADRDKIARLNACSGYIEAGKLFLPENEPWVSDYINTMCTFPAGQHDDDVDCTTHFLLNVALKHAKNEGRTSHASIIGR
jgi:predicted phage terminase large subunit-like protein